MLVNKKCTNLARASKNFKPAARRIKKKREIAGVEVPKEQREVEVEDNVDVSEVVAKVEEL